MDLAADLSRRLESLIRLGTVADVDLGNVRVRVASGGLTTDWLPWLTHRAGTTTTWDPPTVGEQVLVLCPSGETGAGVVLGALHSDAIPPPDQGESTHTIKYPDGATIKYDHAASHLEVSGIQTATIQASTLVTLDVPETHITGNVTIDGSLTVKLWAKVMGLLSYMAGLSGTGGGAGTSISGNITHTGGDLTSSGISLPHHTHVEHDGGSTGAPQ